MHNKSLIGGGALLGLTLLSGAVLTAPKASADTSGTVDITVTVPAACSLAPTNTTLTKTINPGTVDVIGTANIKALCNDPSGFAIYAVGYTDDVYGKNVLSTELTTDSEHNYDIASGTAESGDTSNWSMLLAAVEGDYAPTIENDYDAKKAIPTSYTKVASYSSNTDASIGGNISSTYTAYISPSQPASIYQGKVKFTLVHPNVSGDEALTTATIIYNPNATDVRGSMKPQYAAGEIVLTAPNYARSGYGFAAWNTKADGTGINFGPNQTIDLANYTDLINDDNGSITLYAKWLAAETGVTMQTFNAAAFEAANPDKTITALKDERDNDVYAIAKLADGNWWMIENLRIDGSVDEETMLAGSQGIGEGFTKLPASTDNFRLNTFNETYPESLGLVNTTLPQINTNNTVFENQTENNKYSYGNYYSLAAAIADTTSFSGRQSLTTSICPKGWRLPTLENGYTDLHHAMGGTNNGDFTPEGSERWRMYPMNFVYSGSVLTPALASTGTHGYYRTGTTASGQAYVTIVRTDALSTVSSTSKVTGMSVRCVSE